MSRNIECPSGLSGEVRGFTVREANLLSARQAKNSRTDVFGQVMSNCWKQTTDPGPYQFDGDTPDWKNVLTGDRFLVVVEVRIETHGEIFAFPIQCPDRGCRQRFEWEMDLLKLPIKRFPESTLEKVRSGDLHFSMQMGDNEVTFKLQTGADEMQPTRMARSRTEQITTSLLRRIESISGIHPNDTARWINDMPLRGLVEVLDQLDDADGGIETEYDFTCPHCQNEWEQEIPFDHRGFFLPRGRGRS